MHHSIRFSEKMPTISPCKGMNHANTISDMRMYLLHAEVAEARAEIFDPALHIVIRKPRVVAPTAITIAWPIA